MHTYGAMLLTCWFCALLATPRKPCPGNEVQELVYTRLLGRQHLLVFFAAAMTAAALVAAIIALPQRIDPALQEIRWVNQYCGAVAASVPVCDHLQPDGRWVHAARQPDGQWTIEGAQPEGAPLR